MVYHQVQSSSLLFDTWLRSVPVVALVYTQRRLFRCGLGWLGP